jgi:hypothetical protein
LRLADGWSRTTAQGSLSIASVAELERVREALNEEAKPVVECMEASIAPIGEREGPIRERQPFRIAVRIRANKNVPVADVGIKLIRSDGVYAFWQSSGFEGNNLRDFEGERTVSFKFDPNYFGAGRYEVTAYIANGWDPAVNYPYSEIYCRAVGIAQFVIEPEIPEIDFGQVNVRAQVEIE